MCPGAVSETLKSAPEGFTNALDYVTPGFQERVGAGPNPNTGFGVLFNAVSDACFGSLFLKKIRQYFLFFSYFHQMIYPFTVGPMQVSSFTWFQGESNCGSPAQNYACQQNALINSWRQYFGNPTAFFGFVELEPWIGGPPPAFRAAQLNATSLPYVGYAIGTDIGDPLGPFGSVHPRNKKLVGRRLANAALTLQYGQPATYLPPTYASSTAGGGASSILVSVSVCF
jgi:hypothetical protein